MHPTQELLSRVLSGEAAYPYPGGQQPQPVSAPAGYPPQHASSLSPAGWRTSQGQLSVDGSCSDFGATSRSKSPSSLSRPLSAQATSVGSHESPPKPIAFGSGRPQRPESTVYTGSSGVPGVGIFGDVQGVY